MSATHSRSGLHRNAQPMSVLFGTAGRIGVWLLPSGIAFDMMRIFLVSAIVGFFYLYFGAFVLEDGAAGYEYWADALVSGESLVGQSELYIRDVGMPLIMLIGGFPFTHSLIGVTIIQTLMGMTMPLLAYSAIHPWFPRAACYTAIASRFAWRPLFCSRPFITTSRTSFCLC